MPYPGKLTLDTITAAALAVADADGLAAMGIRSVAERLQVRPSALYRHCGDGLGLTALVAEHAAAELCDRLATAIGTADVLKRDAGAGFAAMAETYRAYATEYPSRYAALTTDTMGSSWTSQSGASRKALWNALLDVVARLTGDPDDTAAAVAVWSFLHGFAALDAAGVFGASGPTSGFDRGLSALIDGLRRR